ncbi:J domain-containing protein [candidate division WOR-3 bacterium]|nr:J domain-containing protein [candidate division WOR-3 bacterium]
MKNPLDSTFDHRDPYKILGVAPGAAAADIRKAYLGLARRHHPNLFATDPEKYRASTTRMQEINCAYELLSDPHRRGLWDRQHSVAPHLGRVARREQELKKFYDAELLARVIRQYNAFVSSLGTARERQQETLRIQKFQTTRRGSAYIRELITRHYREVMDFLRSDKRISFFDDGLVQIMFLYAGAYEVSPGDVFVTYAYLCHRDNHGGLPPGLEARPPRAEEPGVVRLRLPGPHGASTAKPAKGFGSQVWDWLMEKPGEHHP